MKHVVSVSLGSRTRDKTVEIELGGQRMMLERRGTDGDEKVARALFRDLDGTVDVLGVGGVELYLRVAGREHPLRSGIKMVADVKTTPVVDGRGLKHTLERRVFELAGRQMGGVPRYSRAFMNTGCDRYGMAEALTEVCDEVVFGDLMFALSLPMPIRSLRTLRRTARLTLPVVGRFPISMLYPTGHEQVTIEPKFSKQFGAADIIAGDFLYIRKHAPLDLAGKDVLTNTTTQADVDLLRSRGVRWLITTTPRFDGRSFGTNLTEAALTAHAGAKVPLDTEALNALIDELGIAPSVERLN